MTGGTGDAPLATPVARRSWWWVVPTLYGAGCVAGAVVAPSSWWAPPFVLAVVLVTVLLRNVVPVAYRPSWTRSTLLLSGAAACVAGTYAFAIEPWGPSGWAAAFAAPVIVAVAVWTSDLAAVGGSARMQAVWRRAYWAGRRR